LMTDDDDEESHSHGLYFDSAMEHYHSQNCWIDSKVFALYQLGHYFRHNSVNN
jgi:hypothetical protein